MIRWESSHMNETASFMGLSVLLSELYRSENPIRPVISVDDSSLTLAQLRLMTLVGHFDPEGIRIKDISRILRMTPGATSKMTDKLVQMGLADRQTSSSDRRAAFVTLTVKAREAYGKQILWTKEYCRKLLAGTDPEEIRAFLKVAGTLYGAICLDMERKIKTEG